MKRKELEQVKIFEKLKIRAIKQSDAAISLGITERQVRNKLNKYKIYGEISLIHQNRGKPSKRSWDKTEKNLVLKLFEDDFKGFGPTFAAEKLLEIHNIKISAETLRQAMIKHGIWIKKIKRSKHRSWRARVPCIGIMTQLDGSPHDWFEGRAPKCTLLVFIDDATSRLLWLEFVSSESVANLMIATKSYVLKYGIPRRFYTDNGSVFRVNVNNKDRDKLTQFERAINELGSTIIHASSPQAKGRVERVNRTLQDRLIKEMTLRNISNMHDANLFVQNEYLATHNAKFAVAPVEAEDLHTSPLGLNLNDIFCIKDSRIIQNDFTVKYKNQLFQLEKEQKTIIRPKEYAQIFDHFDGSIAMFLRDTEIYFHKISERISSDIFQPNQSKNISPARVYIPSKNHPWRRTNSYFF